MTWREQIADLLRRSYYQDDTRTLAFSGHKEQWLRMADAVIHYNQENHIP
jgi:hypothetical protein